MVARYRHNKPFDFRIFHQIVNLPLNRPNIPLLVLFCRSGTRYQGSSFIGRKYGTCSPFYLVKSISEAGNLIY